MYGVDFGIYRVDFGMHSYMDGVLNIQIMQS